MADKAIKPVEYDIKKLIKDKTENDLTNNDIRQLVIELSRIHKLIK